MTTEKLKTPTAELKIPTVKFKVSTAELISKAEKFKISTAKHKKPAAFFDKPTADNIDWTNKQKITINMLAQASAQLNIKIYTLLYCTSAK